MAKLLNVLETRMSVPPAKFEELARNLEVAVREHETRKAARLEDEQRRRKAGEQVASTRRDSTRYVIWMRGERKYDVAAHGVSYKSAPQKDEDPLIAWVRNLVKEL